MNINNEMFAPEEDVAVSFEVTEDKPFNKCFECASFRNGCSGPNLTIMDIPRVCEFLQSVRVFRDISYQEVVDGTGVSMSTVIRIFKGKISDPSFYNISAISVFLLGDPNGKYPCAIPNVVSDLDSAAQLDNALRDLERALIDNKDYRAALDNIHTSYNAEMQAIRNDAEKEKQAIREEAREKIEILQEKIAILTKDLEKAREVADAWRYENDRKGRLIDKYLDKMIAK